MIKSIKQALKQVASGVINPLFILFVFISFGLWYITKLNHSYTTTIKLPVKIVSSFDDMSEIEIAEQYIDCQIYGLGYRLLRYKLLPKINVTDIDIKNLELSEIEGSENSEVSIPSLLNAISKEITDVKVLGIVTPRLEIATPKLKILNSY